MDTQDQTSILDQLMPRNWEQAVDLLLVVHLYGTDDGKVIAREQLEYMGKLADLVVDSLTALSEVSATDPSARARRAALVTRGRELANCRPPVIGSPLDYLVPPADDRLH